MHIFLISCRKKTYTEWKYFQSELAHDSSLKLTADQEAVWEKAHHLVATAGNIHKCQKREFNW